MHGVSYLERAIFGALWGTGTTLSVHRTKIKNGLLIGKLSSRTSFLMVLFEGNIANDIMLYIRKMTVGTFKIL